MPARKLKERVGRKVLEKRIQRQKKSRAIVPFEKAQNILIAYSSEQPETELTLIEQFVQQLKSLNKKVTRLIYLGKLKRKSVKPGDIAGTIYLSSDDFNLWGLPVSPKSNEVLNTAYDYIINLSMHSPVQLCSMTACSNASLRIGPYNANDLACYDLMLGNTQNPDLKQFIQDLNHYIPKLHS